MADIIDPGGLVKVKIKDGTSGRDWWIDQNGGVLYLKSSNDVIQLTWDNDRYFFCLGTNPGFNYYLAAESDGTVSFSKTVATVWEHVPAAAPNRLQVINTTKKLHLDGGSLTVNATGTDVVLE